jgi:hypothetical protein
MATDPRNTNSQNQRNSRINLEEIARAKIAEVFRRRILERTNYQEPDDTCSCDDFVTDPPNPPSRPRRREPPLPPAPLRPPVLPPPLPPPPARYSAPQLPSVVPPLIAPPPIIFPPPDIEGDGGGGETGDTTSPPGTTEPPSVTTEGPPSDGGPEDGLWEDRIPCCGVSRSSSGSVSDTDLSLAAEESTHSGEFRNGCYPMCGLEKYREFLASGAGFCDRQGIQICQCIARNNPSNPCYTGNGQVSPPGANLTTTGMLKKEVLPSQYSSPAAYYADRLVST